jgi:hypothetical protein
MPGVDRNDFIADITIHTPDFIETTGDDRNTQTCVNANIGKLGLDHTGCQVAVFSHKITDQVGIDFIYILIQGTGHQTLDIAGAIVGFEGDLAPFTGQEYESHPMGMNRQTIGGIGQFFGNNVLAMRNGFHPFQRRKAYELLQILGNDTGAGYFQGTRCGVDDTPRGKIQGKSDGKLAP